MERVSAASSRTPAKPFLTVLAGLSAEDFFAAFLGAEALAAFLAPTSVLSTFLVFFFSITSIK